MDEGECVDPTIEQARQIDRVCEAFEQAWLAGPPPRIADYLPGEHEPPLPGLLPELLKIDVQQRLRGGEQPGLLGYLTQFPDLESVVVPAYQAAVSSARQPQGSAGAPPAGNGHRVLGDFELLEEIGRGGMGIVYRARQLTLNRIVAVKLILHGDFASQRQIQRFRSEAESAAELTHRNIVSVYAVGQHEDCYYVLGEGKTPAGEFPRPTARQPPRRPSRAGNRERRVRRGSPTAPNRLTEGLPSRLQSPVPIEHLGKDDARHHVPLF